MASRIELHLPSNMEYLGVPDAVLMEIGSDMECSKNDLEELGTSVIEACTNAMEHGNGMEEAVEVEVHMDFGDGGIQVTVFDHGPGFDYDNWQPPTDVMRERGRGILIMREFADSLVYERASDGRFLVRLIKHLTNSD